MTNTDNTYRGARLGPASEWTTCPICLGPAVVNWDQRVVRCMDIRPGRSHHALSEEGFTEEELTTISELWQIDVGCRG